LVVVKIDSTVETDALKAVDEIQTQGINRLDLVIANAGMARSYPKVSELKVAELQAHLAPNVFGVVWLYQATLPLLRVSDQPKWVTMGSTAGSLGVSLPVCARRNVEKMLINLVWQEQPPVPNAAYGPSKAAVHWVTKRINVEEDALTAFVIHPG
jgi:norsolorinic acid ketoreductase